MGGVSFSPGVRYEFKYLVPPATLTVLRSFVTAFLPPDRFMRGGPYRISSLYLDSPDLRLYRQTLTGEKNRFKLRVRTYSDDPDDPAFLEVKRRVDAAVFKQRVCVERRRAEKIVIGSSDWSVGLPPDLLAQVFRFSSLVSVCGAGPCIRVRYRREAYEAPAGEPLRITFDTDLEYATTQLTDLSQTRPSWTPTPVEGVVFEIKFSEHYPMWVADLIRGFELQRRSVPKYVLSLEHAREGRSPLPTQVARDLHLLERV
jgi:hypothetical protein